MLGSGQPQAQSSQEQTGDEVETDQEEDEQQTQERQQEQADTARAIGAGPEADIAAKQQEQREAKERQLRAIKQQRQRQLESLVCANTYTTEDLCSAAWNGGDINKFLEILNFLSVDEINKTNSRGQTALVSNLL